MHPGSHNVRLHARQYVCVYVPAKQGSQYDYEELRHHSLIAIFCRMVCRNS
uniref:Uncharacterized protein n=1 Tax=Arundo donax TaxID=35708 RepID=A0A0A9A175_ARUDO